MLVIFALLTARLTSFITGSPESVNELVYLAFATVPLIALLLLRYDQTVIAAWLIMLGSSGSMFYASTETVLGLLLSPSGYAIGLVIAIMILPDQHWRLLFVLDLIAIIFSSTINYHAPMFEWSANDHLSFGLIQFAIIMVAALAVGTHYSGVLSLFDELQEGYAAQEALHRELREKTDLLEIITANAPVRIAYFDNQQRLRFHNRAFAEAFPKHLQRAVEDEGNAQGFIKFARPERMVQRRPYLEAAMRGETAIFEMDESDEHEAPEIIKTIYVPHMEDGQVVGRVSLGIDISELREVQRQLQESLELFQLVINNVPARIAYVDRSNTLIFVNERVNEHLGLTVEEAVGRKTTEILAPDYVDSVMPYALKAYKTRQNVVFDVPMKLHNGTEIIERSYYFPHIIDDQVEALFMLHMDVTDIKRTEASLKKSQKLESLGILAGGIAHDFNNLLVAMLGQNSLALAKIEEDHPARRHIVQSIVASERASTLTQQMLAYSGRGAFTIGALSLNELIAKNLKLFEVSIPKSVQLVTHLSAELPLIEADTAQMQQLIMNLIINAGQAIGENNGRITITTGIKTYTAQDGEFWEITGDELVPGRYVSVQIQDDGVGMDEATKNQIFDPFYTTKDAGTGLGLAAALGIIRGHKGGVHLYSELGVGTVFHLLFPALDSVAETEPEPEAVQMELTLAHTILVVDDEEDIVLTVADMLELKGIHVLQATKGDAAVQLFAQRGDEISLVLLDLMMPGMNGEQVFHELRRMNPEVKVVLSSGYSEAEATRRFIGQGLADFIQKPYDFQTLVSKVLGALEPALV